VSAGRILRLACAALAALATLALAGCTREAPAAAPPAVTMASADPVQHELGRKIWNFRCYFCHGYSGNARTLAATYLQPPPRDFTRTPAASLRLDAMVQAITHGRPGTAMKGFAGILQPAEVLAVAGFVRREFMESNAENTRYHTVENGWPDHERHRDAFAFAKGELALDTPWEQLDAAQQRGKRLFLSSCVTCHDHARTDQPGAVWETQALSYPRDAYCTSCHEQADGSGQRPDGPPPAGHPPVRDKPAGSWAGSRAARGSQAAERVAGTYRAHDTPPPLPGADARERRGEALFQSNCAFCHAADGSAKSWIGRFLQPHPRDLTDPQAMAGMTRARLAQVIEDGLEGTSMPGWKLVLEPAEIDAVVAYIQRAFHPVRGG
jgi:cytochrome c oxidase cbb3-type subunit 3